MSRCAVLLAFVLALSSAGAAGAGVPIAGVPESGRLEFSVLRDGEQIGTDVSEFFQKGDRLTVRNRTDIAVEILFVVVYRYELRSEEQWVNGQLVLLRTHANDDGKKTFVELTGADGTEPELLRASTAAGPAR
jgi:hypothetical protein